MKQSTEAVIVVASLIAAASALFTANAVCKVKAVMDVPAGSSLPFLDGSHAQYTLELGTAHVKIDPEDIPQIQAFCKEYNRLKALDEAHKLNHQISCLSSPL